MAAFDFVGMPLGLRSLRNLFSPPATRRYPAERRAAFAGARGHVELELSACTSCGLCAKVCPTRAITMDEQQHTLAIVDLKCILCSACVEACSSKSLSLSAVPAGAFPAADRARREAKQGAPKPTTSKT